MLMSRLLAAVIGCAMSIPSSAAVIFSDNFSGGNQNGWMLGGLLDGGWQIGQTQVSSGQQTGNPDPASDHSQLGDNKVAGVVLGGNIPMQPWRGGTNYFYLTSPKIKSGGLSNLKLEFYRWLNSDTMPYMQNSIDVFDGSAWVNLFLTDGAVADTAWTLQSFDISAYANDSLYVRFGYRVLSNSAYSASSWNIDDFAITGNAPSVQPPGNTVPAPATAPLTLLGLVCLAAQRRRHGRGS